MPSRPQATGVEERASAARGALGEGGVEWERTGSSDISSTTRRVLSVDSLPSDHAAMLAVLGEWRSTLGIDAEIHLVERTRPDVEHVVVSAIRSRLPVGAAPFERDVVAAVREVGWTIVAIDRFDEKRDGIRQRWVELRATDVVAQVERESA